MLTGLSNQKLFIALGFEHPKLGIQSEFNGIPWESIKNMTAMTVSPSCLTKLGWYSNLWPKNPLKKRVFHWAPHFATGTALCRQEVDDLAEAVHVVPQLKAAWPKKSSEARGVGMRLT
jgi:hypothetical protein